MADPQDDADKIRLKRLERLQALERSQSASAGSSSSSSAGASASSSAPSAPTRGAAASASASESAATKPSSSKPGTRTPAAANGGGSSSTAAGASASAPSVGPVRITPKAAPTSGTSTPVSRPSTSTPSTSSRPAASAATPSQQTQQALQIPYPQWFSSTASRIFQITLSQSRAETSNWSIVFLYTLHQELQDEVQQDGESNAAASTSEAGMRFDEENLERAIVARLSMDAEQMSEADEDPVAVTVLASLPPRLTNLEYLVQCWKRWGPERARLGPISVKPAADSELAKRIEALDFIKRKIIEGIGLQLQEPSLFPQPSDKTLGGPELLPSLLQLPNLESSPLLVLESHQALALLSDIASVYSTPASSADLVDVLGVPLLQPIIDKLGAKESSIQAMLRAVQGANPSRDGILDLAGLEWRNVVRTVNDIAEIKALANMFVEMPNWIPAGAPAQTIELESLLGPLLRLGCFTDSAPSVAKAYFAQPSALSKEAIEASSNALRNTLSSLQGLLFNIFNLVVRSSPASREGVLSHFAQIVKLNHRRDGMRVDRRTVSSDGFMINNFSVLMDFATPFMDASYSRIDKIDVEYFRKCKGRLDISEMTKIHATSEEAKEYYAVGAEVAGSPNFISEIFFLSTAFMHYGLAPALTMHEHLYRQLRHMQDDLKEAEQNRQYDGTPQEAAYRQQLERHKAEVEAYHARIIASEVQLCDPGFIARAANFSSFVMTWLVRQVDPRGQHPMKEVELESLPAKTPLAFSMLPEYIVEDVTEFYFFISRYAPQTMIDMQKDQLLVFIVVFLCTPYINNPYLKGKFVEILYRNTRSWGPRYPRGTLGDTLNYHPLALKGLLPALMTVYCQIEFTGQHNQFYEKFEVRHQISKILRLIWETREHREAFKAETGKEDFVRFVNFLLNDTTFLMDEALGRLKQIHDLQQEMADKATWDAQTDEQKKDKEKLLKSAEGQAHSNLVYGYESLFLFKTLTAEAPIPFLRGEIVDRLTSSLDYNLNILAGPQCQELRVQDKEKYRFKPRELLADIMQIIINLANNDAYVVSTAKDGRSYSKALFDNAIRIASRAGIKTEQQLQILRRMVTKIEELKVAEAEEDEMGEAPDEFLDPLTAEVMDDPVLLPSSQTIVDFNTIKQALLTVQQDPFNRSPLKLEDIDRDDRLRGEIQAWRDKRRADRLAKIEQAQPELKEAPAEPSGGDTTMEG